jgi:outer membrane usher protein
MRRGAKLAALRLAGLGLGWLLTLTATEAVGAQDRLALVDLQLNAQNKGEIAVVLRGSEILAKVADLTSAGVKSLGGKHEKIRGDEFVILGSLAPDVTYKFDDTTLLLALTAKPELLGEEKVNLGSAKPASISYADRPSAFLNYAFNLRQFSKFDGFIESGITFGNNLLYSSVFRNDQGQVIRGLTNLTIDAPEKLHTLTLGDQLVTSQDPLGGSGFLGGIGFSRNFGLDPYFVRFPTQNLSGALTTPSTLEVYVNGHLVRQELLPPGQFQLSNIPMTLGSGSTQVVIKDAFGNQTQINSPFYLATQVLGKGLSDYSYDLGFQRNDLATSSFDYRQPALFARQRYGLTEWLTPGFRIEATPKLASAGPMVDLRMPLGTLEISGGASAAPSGNGAAASMSYSYVSTMSLGGAYQLKSPRYSNLSLSPLQDRPLDQESVFVGFPLGTTISVFPQYIHSDYRDAGRQDQASLSVDIRFGERFSAFVSVTRIFQARQHSTLNALVALNYFFGNSSTASIGYGYSPQENGPSISLQKALPYGPGYGYRVQAETGTQNNFNGTFQYQNNYGLYEADYGRVGGQDITALSASGGLAAIDGKVFATRAIQQGFALLQVPDVAGVKGYLSNQEMGQTDSKGDLLIPNLLPYYGNQISIEDKDIPLDYSIGETQKIVAPSNRGGIIVAFPVHKLQAFFGKLEARNHNGKIVSGPGELTIMADGKDYASPIGKGGEFYLENVPPGPHPARAEFNDGSCSLTIDLPKTGTSFVKLGTLSCEERPDVAAKASL